MLLRCLHCSYELYGSHQVIRYEYRFNSHLKIEYRFHLYVFVSSELNDDKNNIYSARARESEIYSTYISYLSPASIHHLRFSKKAVIGVRLMHTLILVKDPPPGGLPTLHVLFEIIASNCLEVMILLKDFFRMAMAFNRQHLFPPRRYTRSKQVSLH